MQRNQWKEDFSVVWNMCYMRVKVSERLSTANQDKINKLHETAEAEQLQNRNAAFLPSSLPTHLRRFSSGQRITRDVVDDSHVGIDF